MAVITLTSAKGAPGVTTTALGLALIWPRPCLLIEADMAGSSSILAGYLRGEVRHDRGLIDLADAYRRDDLAEGLHRASMPLGKGEHARFVPGLRTTAQAGTMARLWEPLAAVLRGLERTGIDVLIDAGRASASASPMPLMRESDIVLLVTRSSVPALAGARALAGGLRADLTDRGVSDDSLVALMVGEGQPYSKKEAAAILKIPVPASIDWDPVNAEVLSLGKDAPRRWQSSRFVRSTHAAASTIDQLLSSCHERLAPGKLLDMEDNR